MPRIDSDLVFQLARSRLDQQLQFVDEIDNKLGLLFSIGSALIGVLGAVVATQHSRIVAPEILILGACVASYAYLAQNAIRHLWSQQWAIGPDIAALVEAYQRESRAAVKLRAAETLLESYEGNYGQYEDRLKAMRRCLVALSIETGLLLLGLAWAIWA